MNKQDAAEFLGVSVRAVERYTQQGKLSVTYTKGRTRPIAEYRQDELDALRAEINANLYHQRPAHEKPNPANSEQAGGLVAISPSLSLQRAASPQTIEALGQAIADALQGAQTPKMLLSLTDAAEVSGLSASHLLKAIHSKLLDGRKIGRGFKIRPADLHEYAKRVWMDAPRYEKREVKQLGDGLKAKAKKA
jgi:excisionase family DNA binding protein